MKVLYKSTAPLVGAHEALNRVVGITVYPPFAHRGLNDEMHVEVEHEFPCFNATTTGSIVPEKLWRTHAKLQTKQILKTLEAQIAELRGHHMRLTEELKKL